MPPKDDKPQQRSEDHEVTEGEILVMAALAGGAFALMAATMFVAVSVSDKVTFGTNLVGGGLAVLAVAAYVTSVIYGGRGAASKTISIGARNPFDNQAKFGILGLVLSVATALVLALGPKVPDDNARILALEARVDALTKAVAATGAPAPPVGSGQVSTRVDVAVPPAPGQADKAVDKPDAPPPPGPAAAPR